MTVKSDGVVHGDRYRLEQVIVNLLSNAMKYGAGSPVFVSVTRVEDKIILTVKDQGPGVPLEFRKKIFDKFERGRQDSNISGLGLGLFISKEIVTAHHGTIELVSRADVGCEFRVILPIKTS